MRRRFFVEGFENGCAVLTGDAAEHLGRVLRAQAGQSYELSDGKEAWLGEIESASKREVRFRLVEPVPVPALRLHLTLLLSIVKFDRFELCLEKATELGVTAVIPLAASRSEKGLLAAAPKRSERWRKILLESAQQCRRLAPPQLLAVSEVPQAVGSVIAEGTRLLLSERPGAKPLRASLRGTNSTAAVLAVGPEGGWSEGEFVAFKKAGFQEVSLGTLILRTETAVIAALASLQYELGWNS